MPKVTFTLGIGLATCEHEENFDTEKDLGLIEGEDYKTKNWKIC